MYGAELYAHCHDRAEYSDRISGGFYIPLANWKGSYDSGYSIEHCYTREWSTAVAPPVGPQVGGDTTKSNATSGTEELCPTVEWPAQHEWAARQYRRGYGGPRAWMGSLIYGQRDFSGLHYRRNRFYDAEQGRFTQEDPIGLAGGINLYGFANGDPVGYSDPYGLSAEQCCQITDWRSLYRHIVPAHVEGTQGPKSMFREQSPRAIRQMISETVEGGMGRRVETQLVDGERRFVYHRAMGSAIGTKGERILKVVVAEDGALVTSYPIRSSSFLRGAARGAAGGAALMILDHVMDPPGLNAGENQQRPSVRDEPAYRGEMLPVMIPLRRGPATNN